MRVTIRAVKGPGERRLRRHAQRARARVSAGLRCAGLRSAVRAPRALRA